MSTLKASPVCWFTQEPNFINALAWSPDGTLLASSSNLTVRGPNREEVSLKAEVQVWHALTGEIMCIYRGHSAAVIAVAWSPDGTRLASAGYDQTVQIWQALTGNPLYTYRGHSSVVGCIEWSPDGTYLASSASTLSQQRTENRAVQQVWDATTGKTLVSYEGQTETVYALAWSPDGTCIASASRDQTVQIWQALSGNHLFTYTGHTESVYAVAWSPDGTCIASASQDHTTQVWQALSGERMHTFSSPTRAMMGVAWSPDGKYLATTSHVGQIWNATTGELVLSFGGLHAGVAKVIWSNDGTHFAFDQDTAVQVWQVQEM